MHLFIYILYILLGILITFAIETVMSVNAALMYHGLITLDTFPIDGWYSIL